MAQAVWDTLETYASTDLEPVQAGDQVSDQASDQVSDQVKRLLLALGAKTLSAAELMELLEQSRLSECGSSEIESSNCTSTHL